MSIGGAGLPLLKPNERAIEVYSKPDKDGNQSFAIYRYSEHIGSNRNETGNAVQHFDANLQEHIDRLKKENFEVYLFDIK